MTKEKQKQQKGGQMPKGGSMDGFHLTYLSFYVPGAIALDFVVGRTV